MKTARQLFIEWIFKPGPSEYALEQAEKEIAEGEAYWGKALAEAMADARRAALEEAAKALRDASMKWVRVAVDNQHPTDSASRVVAVELSCQADIIAALSPAPAQPAKAEEPRCYVTNNLCGTDTWAMRSDGSMMACECGACQAWLKTRQSTFSFPPQTTEKSEGREAEDRNGDILALAAQMASDMESDAEQRAVALEKEKWTAETERDALRERVRVLSRIEKAARNLLENYTEATRGGRPATPLSFLGIVSLRNALDGEETTDE